MDSEKRKTQLRDKFLDWRRNKLTRADRTTKSRRINEKLLEFLEDRDFSHILLYYPIQGEVQLINVSKQLIDWGMSLALPRMDTKKRELHLYQLIKPDHYLQSLEGNDVPETLSFGDYDVLEPVPEKNKKIQPSAVDVALIPGVSFDPSMGRLGYGKGYYDRLLERFPENTITVGIAYEQQISDEPLPMDDHDQRVDYVVTEESDYYQ